MAAMPARYVFERGAWSEAAALRPLGTTYPFVEAITYFTRSVGEARSGDLAAARQDAAQLQTLQVALATANNTYWATEVEVQRLAANGWIALKEGKGDEALTKAIASVRARGGIVVVVAHRPSAIAGVDMLLMMHQGRAQAFGIAPHICDQATHRVLLPSLKKYSWVPQGAQTSSFRGTARAGRAPRCLRRGASAS